MLTSLLMLTLTLDADARLFQDYSDATTVMIRGRASLKLQDNSTSINMDSEGTAVPNSRYLQSGAKGVSLMLPLLIW